MYAGSSDDPGVLIVLMEPPASLEEEFNDWYDTEHLPQRTTVPGFVSGARWVCMDGWPRWAALYDLSSVSVLERSDYRAVSGTNSTPWSRRMLPRTIGRTRAVMRTVVGKAQPQPTGQPSRLVLIRFSGLADAELSPATTDAVSQLQALGASNARAAIENGPEQRVWLIATFDWPVTLTDIPDTLRHCGTVGADLLNLYALYHRS